MTEMEAERAPLTILMSQSAHGRIAPRLTAPALEVVVMAPDRQLQNRDGQRVSVLEARPAIVWAGSDTFVDGSFGALAQIALDSPSLTWFQSGAAGADDPTFVRLLARGVRLTTGHASSEAVSDYVLAGVLDHLQRGTERRANRRDRRWVRLPFTEVAGLHWLVVGFGAIGQGVARRARAFGADITGIRRSGGAHELARRMETVAHLREDLSAYDVIVLSLPLGPETRHLVDANCLSRMKAGSLLVNVSRGDILDEAALLRGLEKNRPGYAVLDVCSAEPLPRDHAFWTHPKITLTAHLAGMGSGLVRRSDEEFLSNLRRFLDGAPLLNEVVN